MKVEISNKLERLADYVQKLEGLKKLSLTELRNKPIKRAATERFFQMAIESVIDISSMIISHENLEKPDEYRKTITLLADAGILDEKFAENFSQIAGFRNILVHQYADVDLDTLYQFLQSRLKDFDVFAKQIASYLEEK